MQAESYFNVTPFKHQVQAWEAAVGWPGFALLMEMGTGKTAVALALVERWRREQVVTGVLVVAPKSVCRNWVFSEIPRHLKHADVYYNVGLWSSTGTLRQAALNDRLLKVHETHVKILVMNVEALSTPRGYTFADKFTRTHQAALIIDESTRVKGPTALRTKRAIQLARRAERRLILTGMPITTSPLDLFTQFEVLDHGLLGCENFFSFKCRYGVLKKRYINGRQFDEVVGYQRLDELQALALKRGFRVLKSQCLDLPPKAYQTRYVELAPAHRTAYERLREDAVLQLDAARVVTAPLVLTKLLRLRQLLAGFVPTAAVDEHGEHVLPAELHWLTPNRRLEELEELVDELEGKAIIWTSFVPALRLLGDTLRRRFGGDSVGEFYGGTTPPNRQWIIEKFQDPAHPLRFFVGQVHTGGLGLTLTQARTVIYYDNDWSLEARAQSEDRAHRIGQTGSVTYVDLVAKDTVDEDIIESLREKRGLADAVTGDGWRRLLQKKGD